MQPLNPVDQEQLSYIQSIWQRFGATIISAVAAFVLSYAGYHYWDNRQQNRADASAVLLENFEESLAQNNLEGAEKIVQTLTTQYADKLNASLASLMMAKVLFQQNPATTAPPLAHLQWAVANAPTTWVRDLARIQTMQLLGLDKQHEKVVVLADLIETRALKVMSMELKGDALMHMQKRELAKRAYTDAKAILDEATVTQPTLARNAVVLKVKLQNLENDK